ncbi:glycosyltransferase [Kribbella sp. CA-293567]|uniref:glycosyltransferase n=1 Tax=Kribbella sp. CA-293567 TaxID=3002436 RepID=UPI0022DDAC02|nr:glycosyltransferase [Kribbella sp. CA-293567]WBQ08324.1 glycosyltransferase [Kribbella sp. CA-293567]
MRVPAGRWLVRAGTTFAVASLGLTLDNLRRLRAPSPVASPASETLAVLLPVRDEAERVEQCVRELASAAAHWPGPARVIVLDDRSADGTADALHRILNDSEHPVPHPVEVITGVPTPNGWLGKPWACQQLADAAGGASVLVFVDADVTVSEAGLTATVSLLRSSGLDLVCPYPRQEAEGVAERLVQPLLQWSWMSTLPLAIAESSARPSLTAANGQLLAVDAAAYRRAGGHAAVRADVLEDIGLLRALKRSGGRGVVVDGSDIASCRMYDGWRDLRAGYTKSLWAAFGSPMGAAAVTALMLLSHVVPAAAALRGSRVGLIGYLASVAGRALVARRTGGRVHPDAWAHPLSVAAFAALTADSVVARQRGTLRWKGRPVEVRR